MTKRIAILLAFFSLFIGGSALAAPLSADTIILAPKSSVLCPTGKACIYQLSADGQVYITDSAGVLVKSGTATRFSPKSTAPGSPSNGDVYYNTASGAFQFYLSGWGPLPAKSGGLGFDSSSVAINKVIASPASGSDGVLTARSLVSADLPIIGLTKGGVGSDISSVAQNYFLAGPTGMAGAPTFRPIDASDIQGITLTNLYSTMFSASATLITNNATRYFGMPGSALDSSTKITLGIIPSAIATARGMDCGVGTAPGGTDTVTFTLIYSGDQGATWTDSTLTCTLTGTNKECSDNTHEPLLYVGWRMGLKQVSSVTSVATDGICTYRLGR